MKNNSHVTVYLYDVGAWTWAIKLILLHSHHHNDDNGNFSHHWACVGEFCDIFQVIIRDIDWDVIHNTTHNKQERERNPFYHYHHHLLNRTDFISYFFVRMYFERKTSIKFKIYGADFRSGDHSKYFLMLCSVFLKEIIELFSHNTTREMSVFVSFIWHSIKSTAENEKITKKYRRVLRISKNVVRLSSALCVVDRRSSVRYLKYFWFFQQTTNGEIWSNFQLKIEFFATLEIRNQKIKIFVNDLENWHELEHDEEWRER